MILGLPKGQVELYDHDPVWIENASETILFLSEKFGNTVVDIQHIGSTAIRHIKAKPIIDIVVGVTDFGNVKDRLHLLDEAGIIHRPNNDQSDYMMFIIGDLVSTIRTHHIHVVPYNGEEWVNQLNFRDYMNEHPDEAKKYEELKLNLCNSNSNNRSVYTSSKQAFIEDVFTKAAKWRELVEKRI